MKIRITGQAGEALHFAARRFETIARVSILPLALSLIFSMAATFAALSVAYGRVITFSDVADSDRFAAVRNAGAQALGQGLMQGSLPILVIVLAAIALNVILTASYMAPLIRYAGLGEKPPPGLIRAPFGPSQVRLVVASVATCATQIVIGLAPVAIAFFMIVETIQSAASRIYASFPDAGSLHTVDYVTGAEALGLRGTLWFYDYGLIAGAGAALTLAAFLILVLHHGRRSDGARRSLAGRVGAGTATLLSYAALLAGAGALYGLLATFSPGGPARVLAMVGESAASRAMALFGLGAFALICYVSARFAAYPAIAVCRASMAPAGLFALTRGGNVVRLLLSAMLLTLVLAFMQTMLSIFGFGGVIAAGDAIGQLIASLARISSGDEAATAAQRIFVGVAAFAQIAFTLAWAMFANGVGAGFMGRLYRDSEASLNAGS